MTQHPEIKDIEFGGPATYRIVVKGALDDHWSDRLAGMAISVAESASAIFQPAELHTEYRKI